MEALIEKLQQAGLTGNEAKVYLELLKRGELTANQIAKNLSMDRTLSYSILNHLIEKGQASYIIKENKKFFQANNPENLLTPVKKQTTLISELIPLLKNIKQETNSKYEIKVFEGKEGLRSIMHLYATNWGNEFLAFGATGRAYDILLDMQPIMKEMEKKGIKGRIITNPKYKSHPMTKAPNLQIRYLKIKSDSTTSISKDFITIHLAKEKPLIILIKNKDIAESYKNHFEYLWKAAKP